MVVQNLGATTPKHRCRLDVTRFRDLYFKNHATGKVPELDPQRRVILIPGVVMLTAWM